MPDPDDRPIVNVVGERVALGPLRRALLPLYERWMNDFAVIENLGVGLRPMTSESETAWFELAATSSTSANYTIYERSALRPIGTVSLRDIDHSSRTATFGILIGERQDWSKGYRRDGFREIGRRRQARRYGREQDDIVFMDCLSAEFERPRVTWSM